MPGLTIVMYHYVREIANSRYKNIKGLEYEAFKSQLDFIEENYRVISADDLFDYKQTGAALPQNACLLTFDDGYKDHFQYVFPELQKRKLKGCFFPAVQPALEKSVLSANKIQFVLAATEDESYLSQVLIDTLLSKGYLEEDLKGYWRKIGNDSRFDSKEVSFFKEMLQYVLPENLREQIIEELFSSIVSTDSRAFSEELYMSMEDMEEMLSSGMYIGNHTYSHRWLDSLTYEEQKDEIQRSLDFLSKIGAYESGDNWIMCFPYGGYNTNTIEILSRIGGGVGFTGESDVIDLEKANMMELPRLDTNDLPQS